MTAIEASGADERARLLSSLEDDALASAMAVVPHLFSRNRMFSLMSEPRMRRARRRAILLRTAVRQLASGAAREVRVEEGSLGLRLVYDLPRLAYQRRLELSELEYATVAFLVERAGSDALAFRPGDRAEVDRTLASLSEAPEPSRPAAAEEARPKAG